MFNFFFIAKQHDFVFHNAMDCNNRRGFKILVVVIYSDGVKQDLDKVKNTNYESGISDLKDNNGQALEIFSIDINPLQKIQKLPINIKDNAIGCMVFAVIQNVSEKHHTKISLSKDNVQPNQIHIECVKYGVRCK